MPRVAINSVTPCWLTSRDSANRSISHATTTIVSIASTNAIAFERILFCSPSSGGSHSAKRAIAKAANNTIAPWAKLNTPLALKISTKPSATSEYNIPTIRPLISVSRKKPMSSCASVLGAQVRVDHVAIAAHFGRRAVADLAAIVEHHDAVGDVHHHAHVVLDQHDRGAELVVDVEDEAAHVLLLLEVHAGHRLVG